MCTMYVFSQSVSLLASLAFDKSRDKHLFALETLPGAFMYLRNLEAFCASLPRTDKCHFNTWQSGLQKKLETATNDHRQKSLYPCRFIPRNRQRRALREFIIDAITNISACSRMKSNKASFVTTLDNKNCFPFLWKPPSHSSSCLSIFQFEMSIRRRSAAHLRSSIRPRTRITRRKLSEQLSWNAKVFDWFSLPFSQKRNNNKCRPTFVSVLFIAHSIRRLDWLPHFR